MKTMSLIELYPRVAAKPRLTYRKGRWSVGWDGHLWRVTLKLGVWYVNTDTARIVEYERRMNRPRDPVCPVAAWPVASTWRACPVNVHSGGSQLTRARPGQGKSDRERKHVRTRSLPEGYAR
jgi:hypothetical protein